VGSGAIVDFGGLVFLTTSIASVVIGVSTHGPQPHSLDENASLGEVAELSSPALRLSQHVPPMTSR